MTEPTPSETSNLEEGPEAPKIATNSTLRQITLVLILMLPSIAPGMSFGFSAVTLDRIPINISQGSWFTSLGWLSLPLGCIASGSIMDNWGRRPALLLISIIGFCGWLILVYASTTTSLYISRILTGMSAGLASAPSAIYIGECIAPNSVQLRGVLLTLPTITLSVGIFFVYLTGSLLRYTAVAGIAAFISVIAFLFIIFFIPESPAWLLLKGRREDAERAHARLGLARPLSETRVENAETAGSSSTLLPSVSEITWSTAWEELKKPEAYKPLVITSFFFFFQQFSGIHVVISYLVDVVRASGFVLLSPYFITVMAGLLILISSLTVPFMLPKLGIKGLSTVSGLGIAISWLIIGLFIFIRRTWVINLEYGFFNFIPLIGLILNVVSSSMGFLPLPFVLIGEIFPPRIRGVASGIATCIAFIFSFIAVKTYLYLQIRYGSAVFFFYGLMALFGVLHVNLFLPETTGKTLQEIVNYFSGPKSGYERI